MNMARAKKYIDTDVVTEAKKRIRHLFDTFDNVVVMFSGGKDSLVCMHLVHEVGQEYGQNVVKCVFRDNELIPQGVWDFVNEYRQKDWVDMRWLCLPIPTIMQVLDTVHHYVQWDPARAGNYVRDIPEWAERNPPGVTTEYDQGAMDWYIAKQYKGKVCLLTGVRADESLMRFRSVVNKLNRENWINDPPPYAKTKSSAKFKMGKPIYDWTENDIFKYCGEENIRYCSVYNSQLWGGMPLRVSTPEHPQASRHFHLLRSIEPELYQRIVEIWPELLVHERYHQDVNKNAVLDKYGADLDGVKRWILDTQEDEAVRRLALLRLQAVRIRSRKNPLAYPARYVLKSFLRGEYKKEILPLNKKDQQTYLEKDTFGV